MTRHRIAVVPGDGIGREVMDAARRVLERAGRRWGFGLDWDELDWGCEWYRRHGRMMPADGLDRLAASDAILLGAVGAPDVPDHVSLWGLLIPIRRAFRQYVNRRPVRLLPGIASPLVSGAEIDLEIVRENNEGEYSEIGGRLYRGEDEELSIQEAVFTRRGVDRVVRYAFELARARGRPRARVTSATKSNGIIHTMPFWDERFRAVAAGYPGVETDQYLVDALAATVVLDPGRFDVIVASNLFGDILSDLAAAVAGSIGIAPSANLNPERELPSMFEPVHGSAPDIAGKGLANPVGMVWSAALMLGHLGHPEAAAAVERSMEASLADPATRTRDVGGRATTATATEAMLDALQADGGRR
jgi:tartrate dehydrogenase/decarboxylase/D-malate dehydrogenase